MKREKLEMFSQFGTLTGYIHIPATLSKLEWFAGMALIGLTSDQELSGLHSEDFAIRAFGLAEAMLKEAEKRQDAG